MSSDLADSVASNYKGIYTRDKYAELELSSISRHGNAAIPALQMLRSRLGMDKIARPLSDSELATILDRHIVTPDKNLDKIASIIDNAADILKTQAAIKRLRKTK